MFFYFLLSNPISTPYNTKPYASESVDLAQINVLDIIQASSPNAPDNCSPEAQTENNQNTQELRDNYKTMIPVAQSNQNHIQSIQEPSHYTSPSHNSQQSPSPKEIVKSTY